MSAGPGEYVMLEEYMMMCLLGALKLWAMDFFIVLWSQSIPWS